MGKVAIEIIHVYIVRNCRSRENFWSYGAVSVYRNVISYSIKV